LCLLLSWWWICLAVEIDARAHFPQMAFLALKQSKNLRSRRQSLGYAAQLFNYAAFQINYVRLLSNRRDYLGCNEVVSAVRCSPAAQLRFLPTHL